ncbi:MAG: PASTA domain-containing protein [Bacteroidetes bacterium]|nr:PASTA domain-containing protein [Bacteroidota bacterium]
MFKFITNRPFWVNLLVAIGVALIILFIFLQLLGVITKHGQYLTVPSVLGKDTKSAISLLESKGFEVEIQDSVYIDTAKMGTVLKQLPDPNSTVKVNRTVFLTINRVTLPMIDMPALKGKTVNFAIEILNRSHLVLGDTVYKPDFMRGSVLSQSYNGKEIESGAKLPWGSKVDLVIGSGLNQEYITVPSLLGLTLSEAKIVIEQNSLILGAVIVEQGVSDTANAFVYQQSPPKYNSDKELVKIKSGQIMDLWVSKINKAPADSIATAPEP